MNPRAKTRHMKPSGVERPYIYVLGEAPGETEDELGEAFVGKSGAFLRERFPANYEDFTRFDNVVRTRPPKNRDPSFKEIECYRPTVAADIEKAAPDAILAVGKIAAQWCLPELEKKPSIFTLRGRRFPVRFGSHACWCYPVLHPAFLLRLGDEQHEKVPGREWRRTFDQDVAAVFEEVDQGLSPPEFYDSSPAALAEGLQLFPKGTANEVVRALRALEGEPVLALDVETHKTRPYAKVGHSPRLLTLAIGTNKRVVAFPWEHPQAPNWGPDGRRRIQEALLDLLRKAHVVAHSLSFELEWLAYFFDHDPCAMRAAQSWGDTMVQAFILDEREGGQSLDFLCALHFGIGMKSLTRGAGTIDGKVNRKSPITAPLSDLLYYNALDVKWTYRLNQRQGSILTERDQLPVYEMHMRRLPTVTLAQWFGMPIAEGVVGDFRKKHEDAIAELDRIIKKSKHTKRYKEQFGVDFNPAGAQSCIQMFRDVLGRKEGQRRDGYTADEEALAAMTGCDLAQKVLAYRRQTKLLGTYIEPFARTDADSQVYSDGCTHTNFMTTRTRTTRLASKDPNEQNWPVRKDKEVRSIRRAPPGWSIFALDYGQIEARVIAMASRDRKFVKALWEDYDIHMEQAQRAAKRWPKLLDAFGGDIKKLRSMIKTFFVFPLFYGAQTSTVSRYMDMPEEVGQDLVDAFWEDFSDARAWQQTQLDSYEENGYIEGLTGRRRHRPLSKNMILNTPIQGVAADLVLYAMDTISEAAMPWHEEIRCEGTLGCNVTVLTPWRSQQLGHKVNPRNSAFIHPRLQIHDDLTFLLPDAVLDESIEKIVSLALNLKPRFPFINVPITVEGKLGKDWSKMEEIGVFSSQDLDASYQGTRP